MMEVTVPEGLSEGDALNVQAGDTVLEVLIPAGVKAGDTMLIETPPSDAAAAASSSAMADEESQQRVEVTVPGGVAEGQTFMVELETGAIVEVELPPGLHEGDVMEVDVSDADPSPPPAAAAAYSSSSPPAASSSPARETPLACGGSSMPGGSPMLSPSKLGGSRFGDRFGDRFGGSSSRFKQHFQSRGTDGIAMPPSPGGPGGGGSPGGASSGGSPAVETMTFRTDALREPQPEEGCRFYVGQPIQMLRSSGEWTEGTVLELMHGYQTMYRCRLGEGRLEKHLGEDEVRDPTPDEGFRFTRGQTVQLQRPNGLLELATVTSNTRLDRTGSGRLEPWYAVRLHPSATQAEALVETVHEEELQPPRPQLGCEFYVGQLVQGTRKDGSRVLVRVLEFEMIGYRLGYKCAVVKLS